jgi:hypothetical protein
MASPPITIVPLPVVIVEGRIPLVSERVATPVICDSHVVTTIKGGVLCPVEVLISIDRHIIAIAKLVRVSKTINVRVPCPVHDVSFAIRVEISGPVDRDIPIAITINVVSGAIYRRIPIASCSCRR